MIERELLCPDCGHHLHRPKPGRCQWHDCLCDASPSRPESRILELVDEVERHLTVGWGYRENPEREGRALLNRLDDARRHLQELRAAVAAAPAAAHIWVGDHGAATGGNVPTPAAPLDVQRARSEGAIEALNLMQQESHRQFAELGGNAEWLNAIYEQQREIWAARLQPEPIDEG